MKHCQTEISTKIDEKNLFQRKSDSEQGLLCGVPQVCEHTATNTWNKNRVILAFFSGGESQCYGEIVRNRDGENNRLLSLMATKTSSDDSSDSQLIKNLDAPNLRASGEAVRFWVVCLGCKVADCLRKLQFYSVLFF